MLLSVLLGQLAVALHAQSGLFRYLKPSSGSVAALSSAAAGTRPLRGTERGISTPQAQPGAICAWRGGVPARIPQAFLRGGVPSSLVVAPEPWLPVREVPVLPARQRGWDGAGHSGVPPGGTASPCRLCEEPLCPEMDGGVSASGCEP